MPKIVNFGDFLKTEVYGQTVLPDRSILKGQKLVENAKIEIFWVIFKQCASIFKEKIIIKSESPYTLEVDQNEGIIWRSQLLS